MCSTSEIFV